MSTEHNFTEGSVQYQYLENDLQNVNRTLTPWLVVIGHRYICARQRKYSTKIYKSQANLLGFFAQSTKILMGPLVDLVDIQFVLAL